MIHLISMIIHDFQPASTVFIIFIIPIAVYHLSVVSISVQHFRHFFKCVIFTGFRSLFHHFDHVPSSFIMLLACFIIVHRFSALFSCSSSSSAFFIMSHPVSFIAFSFTIFRYCSQKFVISIFLNKFHQDFHYFQFFSICHDISQLVINLHHFPLCFINFRFFYPRFRHNQSKTFECFTYPS